MASRPTLIYLMNTEYPNRKAHSIQITKLMASLAPWYSIEAYFSRLAVPADSVRQAAKRQYGHDLSHVRFHALGRGTMQGLRFFPALWRILRETPENSFFYTRKFGAASKIILTRFLHGRKVVIESHKKDGYYKEELVPESRYGHIRRKWETEKRDESELNSVFKGADLALFTSAASEAAVKKNLPGLVSSAVWYPLDPKTAFGGDRPERFVYCGSLAENKIIDLLFDALALCPPEVHIDCYGGEPDDVARVTRRLEELGITDRFRLKGWRPYAELSQVLPRYRYGLTTMEGIKVVDYLEQGIIPILSRVGTYTGVFGDSLPYYTPDSPESLAALMRDIDSLPVDMKVLQEKVTRYSLPGYGGHLHSLFLEHIGGC
jgi:glycosyltransferase involved in cell wall biosynthesis